MIFVILGTQNISFIRLIKAVEKQIELGNIKEEVIVQAGYTKYTSDKMKILEYIPSDEFVKFIKEANLIITHGGVGSITSALKYNKKVIAAARLEEYGEHLNNHQLEIVENFEKSGYILELREFNKLNETLEQSKNFMPKKFQSNTSNFIESLEKEIDQFRTEQK